MAEAVSVAEPKLTPVICGAVAGVVAFCATNTLGVTVNFEVSLLLNAIVTPPAGAGVDKLTFRGAVWPGAVLIFEGSETVPRPATRTVAVPLAKPVELAVIVAEPLFTPVTVKVPVVLPDGMVKPVGAKVIRPLGAAVRLTTAPVGPAGELRVTLPLIVCVTPTPGESRLTVIFGELTLITPVPG